MTLRLKTIEYALPMITSDISTGTTYTDSADMTIYIPETNGRTFASVAIEVCFHDKTTTAANLTGWGIRGSCNSGTNWTALTSASAVSHSSETIPTLLVVNMTSEFSSRFGSGTSGTFRWGFYANYASATTVTNVSAKLYITYSFDDSGVSTRIKTVKIPIESFNGRLSATSQAIRQTNTASNQIPQLTGSGGFLPESNVTIRQIFAELWANTLPSTTTDSALVLKVDSGGTETTFGLIENGLQTPFDIRILYDISSINTSTSHELYARHSAASGNYFANIGGWITVTYEYNASTTTQVLNSVYLPAQFENIPLDSLTAIVHNPSVKLNIQETNPSLRQSGLMFKGIIGATNTTLNLKIGSQSSYTSYASTSATGQSGGILIVQRADSGAHGGSGISISRGENTFYFNCYASTANSIGGISGIFIINYVSDVVSDPDACNHTVYDWFYQSPTNLPVFGLLDVVGSSIGLSFFGVDTTNYYISNVGLVSDLSHFISSSLGLGISAYTASSETSIESGWYDFIGFTSSGSNERATAIISADITRFFKQYYNDPRPRFNPNNTRYFKWRATFNVALSCAFTFTFHQIQYTITGNLTNYSGNGAGIEVRFYDNTTREYLGSTVSTTGGSFSWSWYDNVNGVFAEARESSSSLGRSDIWTG